jgi:hypothetical protein
MLGDHIHYHNALRTTFFNNALKWTYLVSNFAFPGDYYDGDILDGDSRFDHPLEGITLFVGHRLEFRTLNNKLGFALSESIIYQSASAVFDPVALIPSMFLHNTYNAANSNSLLVFEADYTPLPRLNVYTQFALDDFSLGAGENVPGTDDDAQPSATGFLVGAKTAFALELIPGTVSGIFSASAEFALTDPYLYLRTTNGGDNSSLRLDYVVGTRYNHGMAVYHEDFLGYRYGGDAIVGNLHAGYRVFGTWNVEANILFMAHGTFDKWTIWTVVDNGDGINDDDPVYGGSTPTTSHPMPPDSAGSAGNNAGNYAATRENVSSRNATAYTTVFSVLGTWNIGTFPALSTVPVVKSMELYGQVDLIWAANKGNVRGKNGFDLHCTVGLTYQF